MVKFILRYSQELKLQLKIHAALTNTSMNEIVTKAIEEYINKNTKEGID